MATKKRRKRKYNSKKKPSTGLFAFRGFLIVLSVVLTGLLLFGAYQLVAYAGSLLFSRNPAFTLKNIEIRSDGRFSSAQLKAFAAIEPGVNLFAVDFDTVRANLESVPQIESVRIQRRLPATLAIEVIERDPVLQIRFRRSGFLYLLDRYGVAMRPEATRSHGRTLPLIDGVSVKEPKLGDCVADAGVQHVLALLTVLDDPLIPFSSYIRFDSFDLRHPDFINVRLNDGKVSARFPRHSAREKMVRLVVVLQTAEEQGKRVKTVDLVPDGRNVISTYY